MATTSVDEATIRGDAGLVAGANLNYRDVQRAIRAVFATGQFDDVKIECVPATGPGTKTILAIAVKERPVLSDVRLEGVERVSSKSVRDRIEIPEAQAPESGARHSRRGTHRLALRVTRLLPGARSTRDHHGRSSRFD